MKIFETKKYLIRNFDKTDFESLFKIVNKQDVMKFVEDNRAWDYERTNDWLQKIIKSYKIWPLYYNAIIDKTNDLLIGYIGLPTLYGKKSEYELFLVLRKESQNLGIAKELVPEYMKLAFTKYNLKQIFVTADPNNTPTIRGMEQLGMKLIEERKDEHGLPEMLFSISRDDFQNRLFNIETICCKKYF